jgi:micrococcal nuclease
MEYIYKATVKKIYDGDTITVDIDLGFNIVMQNQKIRLFGINTPEIRGEEREEGLKSKKYVEKVIPIGSVITLKTYKDKKGKYGRWLGEILLFDEATREFINLNEQLIILGYAKKYK